MELVVIVAQGLTQRDVANLRLTSKAVCLKASHDFVRATCGHKYLRLHPIDPSLELFETATRSGNISRALEHLNVVGLAQDQIFTHQFQLCHVTMLANAFTNLSRAPGSRGLRRLTITVSWQQQPTATWNLDLVQPYDRPVCPWSNLAPTGHLPHLCRPSVHNALSPADELRARLPGHKVFEIAAAASRAFNIVMQALQQSCLSVQQLDICTSQEGVGIACDMIQSIPATSTAFAYINFLAISFTDPLWGRFGSVLNLSVEQAAAGNVKKISRLLGHFRDLEGLDLLWRPTEGSNMLSVGSRTKALLLNAVARLKPWPKLRQFSLGGISTTEPALIRFLQNHRELEIVGFTSTTLKRGRWQVVYDVLTQVNTQMRHAYLGPLQDGAKLIYPHYDLERETSYC